MRWLLIAAAVCVVAVAVAWPLGLQGWLAVHTGTVNESGPYYGFFSGFGSDLTEFALVGALVAIIRKYNCEVHRCWRLGRHVTAAGQHVCRRHHPDGHLTAQGVRERHHLYLGSRPGRG